MEIFSSIFEFLIHRPLILMAVVSIPFWVAWFLRSCFPTSRMMFLGSAPFLVSLILVLAPFLLSFFVSGIPIVLAPVLIPVILVAYIGIGVVSIVDLATLPRQNKFLVERELLKVASIGKSHDCELRIANQSTSHAIVKIADDLPDEFSADIENFDYLFSPRSRASFRYKFKPNERGRFKFNFAYLRVSSRLKLWDAYYKIPIENEIFVYPDMKQISQYSLLAKTDRLNLLGVRKSRKIGQDNEFERLRDYTQDDNYKFIDWRTSARRQKLTVKDYQANQSQRIVFMVDCGRMMTAANDVELLDYSLNAMLMLSYVALRAGDSVGLICFSDSVHSFTPPRNGVNHINRLLHASFDQRARFVESRYDEAFFYLRKHCMKRSLVVLITNVIDQINAGQIQKYLSNLKSHHLPLGVLLRDREMFNPIEEYLEKPSTNKNRRFYSAAAAAKILNWRNQVITDLQHRGVLAVDVFPESLTTSLVNQYLEIKAKHLL